MAMHWRDVEDRLMDVSGTLGACGTLMSLAFESGGLTQDLQDDLYYAIRAAKTHVEMVLTHLPLSQDDFGS